MIKYTTSASPTKFSKLLKIAKKTTFLLAIVAYLPLNAQTELGFGANIWNVNCYNNLSAVNSATFSGFKGSYTQKLNETQNLGFNTTLSWATNGVPSNASAYSNTNGVGTQYIGSAINTADRKFSHVHKRKGFPAGNYKITMKEWDDNTVLFINGVYKSFSGENGWGSNRMILNCFLLDQNSTIEVRTGNTGSGITQAILEIVKTDVLITQNILPQDVCNSTVKQLDGSVTASGSTFNQDLSSLNFETGSNTFTSSSNSNWLITASTSAATSGSNFISTKAPISGAEKWFKLGVFSTLNLTNLKLSFRHFYMHKSGTQAIIQISTDNSTWNNIGTFTGSSGNATLFAPLEVNIDGTYNNQPTIYIRYIYKSDSTVTNNTNTQWLIDDIIVTGDGATNISYQWTPSTGLSNPTIANPTFTVTSSQTYTVTATAGNCAVTKNVVINMIQIPTQSAVQSLPGSQPNVYSVVPVNGVTYTWTTIPATGVGVFPNGNTGNSVEFNPMGNGDLIVTPSNTCGSGLSLRFNNPLPVELTNFSIACEQGVKVRWSTASEKNSDLFIVEKSRDLENWTKVSIESAAGNSNVNIDYSVVDLNSWNGTAYYRLKQIDFNGTEKIYGPISSSCESGDNSMNVYPNPTKGAFTVEVVSSKANFKAQVKITDATGKVIAIEDFKLDSGVNQLYFNSYDLTAGIYIISLTNGNNSIQPLRLVIE